MHNHDGNNKDGGRDGMMWMMMACCLLPILFIAFSGRGLGLPTWAVLGIVVVFAGFHFWGMRKSRAKPSQPPSEDKPGQDPSGGHSGHACH